MTTQQAPAGALAGVRVLDIGHGIAGPYAARLLGDLGAEVVKLERPGTGDFIRSVEPTVTAADGRHSLLFEYLNWSKRSVEIDLAAAESRSDLEGWVRWADIVVVSLSPRAVDELMIGPEVLRGWHPDVVATYVSNFGLTGPYRDWSATDLVFQAMGGVMQISGTADREPLKPGGNQSLYCAGVNAAYASVAGLIGASRGQGGAVIDLSIHETVASQLVMNQPYYAFLGAIQGRRPGVQDPLSGEPVPTADGFVSLQSTTLTPVARFAELFDDPRFARPEFATEAGRGEHAAELATLLAEHLDRADSREVFEAAGRIGLLAGFVQSCQQLISCPQLDARGVWWSHPELTSDGQAVSFPARFVNLSSTPLDTPRPAPGLGSSGSPAPVAGAPEAASGPAEWPASTAAGPAAGPLAGLRVVDLSTVFAVPYLGALLADLGAAVIKVEAPGRLDQSRSSFGASFDNTPGKEYWNRASTFQVLNRGKRSVVLDLNTESGRTALRAMLADTDVLLDNFTPRVMRRWGLTFEALSATNPTLVMLSNTGYGSTGPWSSFKAQGTTLEATMGLTTVTGYEGNGPMKAGQSYPDFLACWTGLLSLLSALVSRSHTGSGQWIDLGMYQLGATVIPEAVLSYQVSDAEPVRSGDREAGTIVSGLFATKDHRRWVAVSVDDWARLLDLEDIAPEVAHVAGVSALVESESAVVVRALLADWIRGQRAEDVVEQLQAVGIAAGQVADARDLIEDAHLRDRGFYEWFDYGELGFRPLIGRPFRWDSSTTVAIRSRAPRFGEHNADVLCGPGGMSADQYDAALRDGVTASDPIDPPPAQPLRLQDMVERGSLELDESYASRLRSLYP